MFRTAEAGGATKPKTDGLQRKIPAITQPKAPPEAEEGAEAQVPKVATVEADLKAVVADAD